jgi:RNA polymerase sigma factor (sigma-70 family)
VAVREPTDAELIGESLDDPRRFGVIFDRHYEAVYRYAARRAGISDAGDIAGETFVRAFNIRRRYSLEEASCRPWLLGIATNVIGDHLRRIRRQEKLLLTVQGWPDKSGDFSAEADERLMAAKLGEDLQRALRSLTVRDRDVLLLHAWEGLSYREIAAALGIPAGTVGSRINRARRVIRELVPGLEQITGGGEVGPERHRE